MGYVAVASRSSRRLLKVPNSKGMNLLWDAPGKRKETQLRGMYETAGWTHRERKRKEKRKYGDQLSLGQLSLSGKKRKIYYKESKSQLSLFRDASGNKEKR